jgi:phosphoribosylaminoimidazole carboxylase (NCAIR synthetase)
MDSRTGFPVVGMVGGGRVARMTHQAAIALGQSLRVLVPAADDAAALVAADVHIGDPTDLATLRAFAKDCDVLTLGAARIPAGHVRALAAEGITVYPGATVDGSTPGKGTRLVALVARSPFGQVAAYPVVQTDGTETLAPAPGLDPERAVEGQRQAIELATRLELVGLLAVELGQDRPLAVGTHDCGLWTVEGSRTSQYEQHLRAVLDYPLGETSLTAPAVVTVSVPARTTGGMPLDERLHHLLADDPGVKAHLYGTGEPIGHVTVLGRELAAVRARAARAAAWLAEGRH